ncbi:disease resistance protein RGA2-like [Macadamia integrifolia]|uniref:disease resistance protein RGA2-like n=1 Tax=Macadamia integrifolia TaxID=60698 RepID=UPI001C527EC4|nr:disease resistance protein RGA2-like [Macadamia integrifolia]
MDRLIYLNELSTFVTGHKRGQCIKELQHLDLRGILSIYNLENVRSRGEAKEANLMGKENLGVLHLSWTNHVWGRDSSFMLGNVNKKTVVDEDDVLEGLRTHSNLKKLVIDNFGGDNLPQWMMSGCELYLPKLVKLFLHDCESLEHVPSLGQLSSLKILYLNGVKRMKSLGSEFYHDHVDGSNSIQASFTTATFPSLEEFFLRQLPNFEEWMEPQGSFSSFPHLERIFVEDCPKLVTMPSRFPSLELLKIKRSNGILLRFVVEVPFLSKLCIIEVSKLKFLPKGLLHNNIEELIIMKCPDLEAIIMPSEEEGVQVIPSSLQVLQFAGSFWDELQHITQAVGFLDELENLVRTVTAIQALLQDAEKQQEENKTIRLFLSRLKDVAYDAEDVLDEFGYQTTKLKVSTKVRNIFLHSISPAFKLKMAHKIKNVNKEFDKIKRDMDSLNFVNESEIVGRDGDKLQIVNMLISSENQDILSTLPIVGMGGLGKTTLAKYVYNDDLVAKYFDKRIWVHVSNDFDAKKILTQITESVTKRTCQFSSIDVIQQNLKDQLSEKRFLLVLDDIWNVDNRQWDLLDSSLKIGVRGSKIIATTRIDEVAKMIGTLAPHHLKILSKEKCWSILKNKAFGHGGAEETPNMVAIGKEIVKKCGGVPLAAKALGGLMHINKDEQEWLSINSSEIWALPMGRDEILPALKLSYDHLPSPLKQCFLYCSIFPKDTYIIKSSLIQQWMALGFLQPSIGGRSMEDIGNDYINYLLWNSFFQDAEKNDFGEIIKFKMHDLVYYLAYSLSRVDNVTVGVEEFENSYDALHLRLNVDVEMKKNQIERLCKSRKLRSLHLTCTRSRATLCSKVLDILFKKFKNLRVLDLSGCEIKEFPSSIKKLKHLRHVDLNFNPIEALPASFTSLYNLETLNLLFCPLKELPKDMRKLVNLRQLLVCRENGYLSHMPTEMGRLIYLNNLLSFVVGHKRGQRIKELQCMDLQYVLGIYNLKNVRSREEAKEANLMGKEKLDVLNLSWGSHEWGGKSSFMLGLDNTKTIVDEVDVLEGLQPHPNLKTLFIENFGGDHFPQWMMCGCELSLPKLVKLFLHDCERIEHVPPLERLPYLKTLHLKGMKMMKSLGSEFYHGNGSNITQVSLTTTTFSSLEELSLIHMPNLEELIEQQGSFPSFPRLERIFVEDCPKLVTMPSRFPSLKLLQIIRSNGILLR